MSNSKKTKSITCQSVFEPEVINVNQKNQQKANHKVLVDAETGFDVDKFLTKKQKKELRKRKAFEEQYEFERNKKPNRKNYKR